MKAYLKKIAQTLFLILLVGANVFFLIGIYDNLSSSSGNSEPATLQIQIDMDKIEVIQQKVQARKVDWDGLKSEILKIIGSEDSKYSFYIENLSTGEYIQFNEEKIVHPASVYKVPLAITILKMVDDGEVNLTDMLLVTNEEKPYTFDALSARKSPYEISVEETLTYLIKYSDNTAMTTLEHRLGGVDELQTKMTELGMGGVTRLPGESTSPAVANIFEELYKQEILSKEANDFLLNLLKNITPAQNDRIPAGVPTSIEVAHKIGTLTRTYQDAGIVYGEKNDYLIVVLNEDIEPSIARNKIKKISEVTYQYLNPNIKGSS